MFWHLCYHLVDSTRRPGTDHRDGHRLKPIMFRVFKIREGRRAVGDRLIKMNKGLSNETYEKTLHSHFL